MQGWECPKCGKCYAPHVDECKQCGNDAQKGGVVITPQSPIGTIDSEQYPQPNRIIHDQTAMERPFIYVTKPGEFPFKLYDGAIRWEYVPITCSTSGVSSGMLRQ